MDLLCGLWELGVPFVTVNTINPEQIALASLDRRRDATDGSTGAAEADFLFRDTKIFEAFVFSWLRFVSRRFQDLAIETDSYVVRGGHADPPLRAGF